jgi:Rad3-related DNA helicase
MAWSLYQNNKFLEPLIFSNRKTQEDVVNEVLGEIRKGNRIIFIHGICGTGKSAIALNLAKELGKTSIVVPIKNLQEQYKKDYENNKYLIKENNEKLKISVITGRKNHKCKFIEDNSDATPKIVREIDSKLHDIFEGQKEKLKKEIGKDKSADNNNIPCKIELKEKNWQRIKKYLYQNKDVNPKSFSEIKDVKRASVAGACPYWCPVVPSKYEFGGKSFLSAKQKKYLGLENTEFTYYQRKPGCPYYEQFNSFIESDVIVFNSLKYKLESALNRKPLTEVEIIDECDEFLDSFSNQRTINLERLQNSLSYVYTSEIEYEEIVKEINEIIKQIKRNPRINNAIFSEEIIPLKETGVYDLLRIFLKSSDFLMETDDESYLFEVEETARLFDGFFNDTYLTVSKKENNLIISLVTTNLAKRFQEMRDKNKIIILMSGTLHSDEVLKNVFGLENFTIIDAETEHQGRIETLRTGMEFDCKYSNFSSNKFSRKDYLLALDKCVEVSKKPSLVHINAYTDLPTEAEKDEYKLNNLISREKLSEMQEEDKNGKLVREFKERKLEILFTTKCSRGIDFPGKECNSIIFTKYPNPNVQDAFWKILYKTKPQYYWEFYKDKAKRELWQKIYRGLRFKEDHIFVLSPDSRVLEVFENN